MGFGCTMVDPEIVLLALKASDCPEICSPAAPTPVS